VYTVVGRDAYQCFSDTAVVTIGVQSYPTVTAGPDIETQTGSELNLRAVGSSDVVAYTWSPADYLSCTNCPSPVSKPRSNISYVVKATNRYGCAVNDTVNIKLVCTQGQVYIPTAFTPNKDYKNDVFYIKGSGVKQVNFLKIYSRTGDVIFERAGFNINDPSAGWNGMSRGYEVPSGTYVYFTEMICDTGEIFYLKGTVVVIK
jgi:gliding motility-associated-like protein